MQNSNYSDCTYLSSAIVFCILVVFIGNFVKKYFNEAIPFKFTADTEKIGHILFDCIDKLTVSISFNSVFSFTKNGNLFTFYDFNISTNLAIVS